MIYYNTSYQINIKISKSSSITHQEKSRSFKAQEHACNFRHLKISNLEILDKIKISMRILFHIVENNKIIKSGIFKINQKIPPRFNREVDRLHYYT